MRFLRRASLLLVLCALPAVTQNVTTGEDHYQAFVAVGEKLKCQCGCSYTVAHCNMLNCHYRELVKPEIEKAITAGLPTAEIVEKMVAMFGSELRNAPRTEGFGRVGWAMPFVALLLGLVAAPVIIVRWKKRHQEAPAAASVSEKDLARYQEAIEKDLARLE
jgi:cytochrome c-type biogenesis protein CcmH/NrfF